MKFCNWFRLFLQVTRPFYQMIKRWIYEGELEDPYHDFFVFFDKDATEDTIWALQYQFKDDHIPSFLNRELARKV